MINETLITKEIAKLEKSIDSIETIIDECKPTTGKWEIVSFKTIPTNRIAKAKKCSICGKRKDKYVVWNYCPNCGAKMEVKE